MVGAAAGGAIITTQSAIVVRTDRRTKLWGGADRQRTVGREEEESTGYTKQNDKHTTSNQVVLGWIRKSNRRVLA